MGVLVLLLGVQAVVVVWPKGGSPRQADAVVVLGAAGQRIERAEQLVVQGYVDVLVLSTPTPRRCTPEVPAEQVCFRPDPGTTRGEARAVADLARRRGWDDLLVVVQNEKALRVGLRLRRCLDADVDLTIVTVRAGAWRTLTRTVHESVALPTALLLQRSC